MSDDRGARLDRIVHAAEVCPPGSREAFVNDACGGDVELRDDVLSRLGHAESNDDSSPSSGRRAPLEPGQQLGPYTLSDLIGAGGMGEVYRATDTRLGRTVALKILPSHLRANPRLHARFEQEARAIAGLNHPHVCTLHDIGCHDGIDFLVMEYIEGETLGNRLRRGPLAIDDTVRYAREVAEALAAAHGSGLVHRDIKPSNIIVGAGGHVKVVDFGLARLALPSTTDATTRTDPSERGVVVGTPRYMSPEQARGRPLDGRTDIFSLGVVMFEGLTGRLPFDGTTRDDYLRHLLAGDLRSISDFRAGVPASLQALIARCLEPDLSKRLDSASHLSDELGRMSNGRAAKPLSAPIRRWTQLRPAARIGITLAVATIAIAATWFIASRWRGEPARVQMRQVTITTADGEESGSRLSPDGKWISFIQSGHGDRRLMVKEVGGGESVPIKTPAGFLMDHLWSADQKQFVCLVRNEGELTLQFIEAPFGNTVPFKRVVIAPDLHALGLLRWIGQTIFIQTDARTAAALLRVDLVDGRFEPIRGPWSTDKTLGLDVRPPEGREVVWATSAGLGRGNLWTAPIDGGSPKRLTSESDQSRKQYPLYTGLGRTVVYQSNRLGSTDLWEIDQSGGEPHYLTSSPAVEEPESASRDGSLSYQVTSDKAALFVWDTTRSGDGVQISGEALSDLAPTASADGRVLVFQRSQPSPIEGFLAMDTDIFVDKARATPRATLNPQKVATGVAPRLSPDGNWLVYLERVAAAAGQAATGQAKLILTRIDTGGSDTVSLACRIPSNGAFPVGWAAQDVAWSSAGDLYFVERDVQQGPDRLMRRRLGETTNEKLLETKPGQRVTDIYPSSDAGTLAYLTWSQLDRARGTKAYQLWTYDVGRKHQHFVTDLTPEWSVSLRGWTRGDAALVLIRALSSASNLVRPVQILVVPPDGPGRLQYRVESAVAPSLAYLSTGREEIYLAWSEGGITNLYAVSLKTGKSRQVSQNSLVDVSFGNIESLGADHVVAVRHERTRDIQVFRPPGAVEVNRGR